MEVIIDGIVYVPKENKSELEIIKEKYATGEYMCLYKDSQWNKCIPILDNETNINDYKLVHKKHKHILDIYLKDNSVDIEYEYPINNMLRWHNINCNWLSIYDETINYRLKQKEWYENINAFPCILINLKTNKPHIAYSYNHIENKIKMETFSSNPNKFRLATNEEIDNFKITN